MKLAEGQEMENRGRSSARGIGLLRRPWNPRLTLESLLLTCALFGSGILGGCAGIVGASNTTTASQTTFQINPLTVNFGNVMVGKQTTQTIAVTNTGNTSVSITQAVISNPQFSLTGVTLPMSMGVGQSGNFTLGVTPTASGPVTGTLTVQGSGSSPVVVSLAATAVAPAPQISTSTGSIDFGSVSPGSQGNATLTISNIGSADLTISVLSLTGATFGVTGITTPKTISAGQSVPVALSFHPTATGVDAGNLTITSNDPTNPTVSVALLGTAVTAANSQLQANTNSLSFGTVSAGNSATQQIILTNTGLSGLQITSIKANGAGYSVNGITTPYTVNASSTAMLNVVFTPTTSGLSSGDVTIANSASGTPLTVTLSGTGIQAGMSISPSSFDFGSMVDGQTKSQTFTVTNTGNASLTISQLRVSGAGYSVSGLATPSTVAVGSSATFSAVFAPTTAGSLAGTVSITSNASGTPTTVALSGTGVAASVALTASPNNLSFGNVSAGVSSPKSVTLTNSGNSNLSISQVTVSAKDFSASGITLPLTLTPGQSQTLNVAFDPTADESISGNVTVSTTQGNIAVIAVSGTGLQAGISMTPSSATLGSVTVGSTGSQTIQLSNTGNAVLTITQANVTGSGFSIAGLSLPLSINPGQSSTFNADFKPTAAGSASGSITIMSNAGGSPSVIGLSGTGVAATETLSFNASSVSFGNVNDGSSSTQSETITNTGNSNVQISQIAIGGTGYSLTGASAPVTLTPAQSLTFNIIFSPTTAGSLSGSVTVTSNATGSPSTITLSGTGVTVTPHTVSLSWTASTSTVSGYNVYRSTTNGSGYAKLNSTLVATVDYTDSAVQNSTTYYYVTTAVDSSGNESAYSNQAQAIIP
jgi:hypothetical protein